MLKYLDYDPVEWRKQMKEAKLKEDQKNYIRKVVIPLLNL